MKVSAILLAGGRGRRFGKPKQFVEVLGRKLYEYSLYKFRDVADEVILVVPEGYEIEEVDVKVVVGGSERYISSYNGIRASNGDIVLIHDTARPLVSKHLILRIVDTLKEHKAVVPYISVVDTLRNIKDGRTIPRQELGLVQTPQGFWRREILEAYESLNDFEGITDDAEVYARFGGRIKYVEGERTNFKITYPEDLKLFESMLLSSMRVGYGYDTHPLEEGRELVLGGVVVSREFGAVGHSDGDALVHAIVDAILGALNKGNIGMHFPDTDENLRNYRSLNMLSYISKLLGSYTVLNIDTVVILEKPKLSPFIDEMKTNISKALKVPKECISIKPKTGNTKARGFVEVFANVLLAGV